MVVLLEKEVVVKEVLYNMKKILLFICVCFYVSSFSQESLSELLKKHNNQGIPYITVQELAMPKTEAIVLDARELSEFEVSHLKNAIYAGYSKFQIDSIQDKIKDKDQIIVVYCSIGIRSETIAEKLKKAGYTNVFNLYGGIFEWKNENFSVFDSQENKTEDVHTFSQEWSDLLLNGKKVFDKENNTQNKSK